MDRLHRGRLGTDAMSDNLPPLPPLSRKRQLSHARTLLKLHRENMEQELKEINRLREEVAIALTRTERACRGYLQAVDELEQLTKPKETK